MRKLSAIIAIVGILAICASARAGVTTRVSIASDGTQANYGGFGTSISADGRFLVFHSNASNLVPGDTNGQDDVFVHDRHTGITERVSVSSDGIQGNAQSGFWGSSSMSANGRFVAFLSSASNLVSGDTNGREDVFVHDRQTGVTERVSLSSDGAQGDNTSWHVSISADGRFAAFTSSSTNLVPGDTNACEDVFVYDRQTRQTTRISVASDGTEGNGDSGIWGNISVSADGRYVLFSSQATNLVPVDTNGTEDVFVHDRQIGQTTRVSVSSDGTQADSGSEMSSISGDGQLVAFATGATNLVPGDTNGCPDVFVHDRQNGLTARISVASDGTQGDHGSGGFGVSISPDGRYVAFYSAATNLVVGDTNRRDDVFVHDQRTGMTQRVSLSSDGTQGNSGSSDPFIDAEGRYVAFCSYASNLVPGDTNGCPDVFVHDRGATGTPPPPGVPGWDPDETTEIVVVNPYDGYPTGGWAKGQLHCHYYNDLEKEWGPVYVGAYGFGSWFPSMLVTSYAALGYNFVCVTEHNHCTSDPLIAPATYVRYCEEVTAGFGHVLAIGVEKHGSWLPRWDEKRYLPWDRPNNLREVIETSPQSLRDAVNAIHSSDYSGGLAILAHPCSLLYPVRDSAILDANPDAISVFTSASNGGNGAASRNLEKWDRLLQSRVRTLTPVGDRLLFAATEDDFTPPIIPWAFGRTWIVAELESPGATQEKVMTALRLGRYWSYWCLVQRIGTGPLLSLTVNTGADGKPIIHVAASEVMDDITFVCVKKDVGPARESKGKCAAADYPCKGDEVFVRVEARLHDIRVYSQPVGIEWNWSSGGTSQGLSRSTSAEPLASPSDLVLTCALPDQLPDKMPPLGYIGRAYFASTTSESYPPDATLTLSYEGIDVTPYGASNLAIYRWDSASLSWAKLTSTVDIGNALVTAPLTKAGLYTISGEVIGDTTAPAASIHTPSSGATLTGPDVIGVQASDNVGVLRVGFYLNDQCIGVDSNGFDGYTCEFDFGRKSAGQYTLKVIAEDVSGNTGQAEVEINISSSGVTPAVAITSPANGASLEGTVSVTGTCGDDSLVTGVFVLADGIPVGEAQVAGGAWTFNLDTSLLANGPHTLSAMVMDEDQNTFEQGIGVTVSGATLESLGEAKSLADGGRARLSGRVVTFGDPGHEGAFYIEELDRFAGIRVEGGLLPAEGDMVSASGVMSTVGGERALVGADVLTLSSSNPLPPPLGMANRNLGGGAFGLYVPGVTGAAGLNNIGLLVTTWGKVTQIGDGYLYIDDGSNLCDGTFTGEEENIGVRVVCDPQGYESGDYLVVTGISSCFEASSEHIAKRILTRKPEDVRKPGE